MNTWIIDFMDGTREEIDGYSARTPDTGLLSIRTTPNGSYDERWTHFPLVNIKSWRKK